MRRLVSASAVVIVVAVGGWTGWSNVFQAAAAEETPEPAEEADREAPAERKRVELTRPGVYAESNCLYVLTKDVSSKGNGFTFKGRNCIVDLGGHTLTFNAEPYRPKFGPGDNALKKHLFTPPFGVLLDRGADGIELRNGRIVQGGGKDRNAKCVFVRAAGAHIHHTTTMIRGDDQGRNFFSLWGPDRVRLHHNYIVNDGMAESGWYGAVSFNEAGVDYDIHHNTIVGGHQGILLSSRRGKPNARIHHNYIQHRRTRGAKAPQGIYVRASGCEIDHNEIVTIDGRGLEPTGGNNHWHHNVVDVRYTSKAKGGFYPENRCYGLWARDSGCNGNRIADNLFVVNNEVLGDRTSNTIGILLCTSPGARPPLTKVTVTGNRLFIRHRDKSRPAWGLSLRNTGDEVLVKGNYIWAGTAGLDIDARAKGSRVEENTFVKAGDEWQMKTGPGAANCVFKANKVVAPPADDAAPAAAGGLRILRRINGYELHWDANKEADVLGYYVYRDGKRVEDRLKCARFYVDTSAKPGRAYAYAVSAVDTSGNEGKKSAAKATRRTE